MLNVAYYFHITLSSIYRNLASYPDHCRLLHIFNHQDDYFCPVERMTSESSTAQPLTTAEEAPLPRGWERAFTPSGQPYFIDHNTHLTTWLDPRTTDQQHERDGPGFTHGPLGRQWEVKESRHGVTYFVDHSTRTTTWKDPRLMQGEEA